MIKLLPNKIIENIRKKNKNFKFFFFDTYRTQNKEE